MIRVGLGFDAHAFDAGRPLVIGGVEIHGHAGLAGHSDADVLSHAIADALLSATRQGDLGSRFPGDERWKDAAGVEILAETSSVVNEAGWSIVNIDATLVAESPSFAQHRAEMIQRIAGALSVPPDTVWVKATTADGLGFTGRAEGIASIAAVLVERPDDG